jgi:hypothetical protein
MRRIWGMDYNTNTVEIDGLEEIEMENTSVEDIDSENINLMFLGIDKSGSMSVFQEDMKHCLNEFKNALGSAKEADEILVARADFEDSITIGGYKKISEFDTAFQAGGCTAMYDAVTGGTEKLRKYRKFLKDQGVRVKAVFAVFSDGQDNSSKSSFAQAKDCIAYLNQEEITTAFISFGGAASSVAKDLGFCNILDVTSSASELRRAFDCLSKSVIESSKSVLADGEDFFQV